MSEHSSVVGGSTANRIINCPSSRLLTQHMPGQEWSEASATGTALHTVVETSIKEGFGHPFNFTGKTLEQIELDEDILEAKALPALEYFQKLRQEMGGFHFKLEQKVGFHELDDDDIWFIEGAYGTADVIFDDGKDRCGIVDWKFGDGVMVSAKDNDQMRFYLAAAIATGELPEVDVYEAHIFQPANSKTPETYASVATYTFAELDEFVQKLAIAVKSEGFNVGKHCRFCPAKSSCEVFMHSMLETIDTDIDGMSPETMAETLSMIPTIISWTKEFKQAARRNAQNGVIIPGYKLDTTYGHRFYKDEKKASSFVQRKFGLSVKERTDDPKLKSFSQLSKIITRMMKQEGSGITPDMLAEFELKHVDRPEFPDTLVECEAGEEGISKEAMRKAFSKL